MPRLKIPDRYQAGVEKIGMLASGDIRLIRDALDKSPNTDTPLDMVPLLASVAPPQRQNEFQEIGRALGALYIVKSSGDVSSEEFAEDVWDALHSAKRDPAERIHFDRSHFTKNLIELMSAELFTVVSKAMDVATDDERIFCHARILTDMRPVFGTEIESGPAGMVIVHLMKIAFHDATSKDHKEFYVSLDADDLQTLKKIAERAEAKASSLKSKFRDVRFFHT